jgi:hypothetical protein
MLNFGFLYENSRPKSFAHREPSRIYLRSITPRVVVSSHFLSTERIYLQYSRYFYGGKMVLAGTWPGASRWWQGAPLFNRGPMWG